MDLGLRDLGVQGFRGLRSQGAGEGVEGLGSWQGSALGSWTDCIGATLACPDWSSPKVQIPK